MRTDALKTSCNARVCPHRMAFMLDNWFRRVVQNPRRILRAHVRPGDTAVDMGCGPGFFTTAMAELVGPRGRVVAVDLQEEMLARVRRKAAARGLDGVISFHRCGKGAVGLHLDEGADFILAYYVVHELPDPAGFFEEARRLLKPDGRCLVVEPRLHVGESKFQKMTRTAERAGLTVAEHPEKMGGRSVLLAT